MVFAGRWMAVDGAAWGAVGVVFRGHRVPLAVESRLTGDDEDGFRDGFCRDNPLISWVMNGKIVKLMSGGQTGLNSVGQEAG
jgi:hypothetical protein